MSAVDRALPRRGLLREITDRAVLDQVFARGRVTRAELAADTGISKPTISAAVRRLELAGLVCPTGSRTGMRGRVATYYELAPGAGWVLALEVDQDGVHTRSADLGGALLDEHRHDPVAAGDVRAMVRLIRAAVRRALRVAGDDHGPLRAMALAVANAVDPVTGEILALPNAPFSEGLLSPREIVADLVAAPLVVANDVNCAALAERRDGAAADVDDFGYLFVGAGLGLGLYVGGRLVRGAHGLAGEVGYLATASAPREHSTLVAALVEAGFGVEGSTALDVGAIRARLDSAGVGGDEADDEWGGPVGDVALQLGTVIGHVIVDTCAIVDPALVLLGGPLGTHPALLVTARETVARLSPSPVRVELGALGGTASLQGAVHLAVDRAREELLAPAADVASAASPVRGEHRSIRDAH